MLLIIVINKVQESFIHLFIINISGNYISPKKFKLLKTFDSACSYIEVSLTD